MSRGQAALASVYQSAGFPAASTLLGSLAAASRAGVLLPASRAMEGLAGLGQGPWGIV